MIREGDAGAAVCLRPWLDQDLLLLQRLNTVEMWAHLGGPETARAVLARHLRYLDPASGNRMFVIMIGAEAVGSIGYWPRRWQDQDVLEIGWMVLPEFQGQGLATRAGMLCIWRLHSQIPRTTVHAFPAKDNPASNAICRKLGFTLIGETDVEFPPGQWMTCNDWGLSLA